MAWPQPAPVLPPSARTAKTLILVGLILEGLFALAFIGLGALTLVAFIGVFFLAAGLIGLLILFLVYQFTYARIQAGNYAGAQTPTLIWTILLFVTLSIIPAILFLVAYIKLGDAIGEAGQAYGMPYSATPYGGYAAPPTMPFAPVPAAAGGPVAPAAVAPLASSTAPPAPLCPRCGGPLSFIPQYNRWYCYRDQAYP